VVKKILIFSAGASGIEILELINQINKNKKEYDVIGFVDDEKIKKNIYGIKVFNSKKIPKKKIYAICGIMDPHLREKIINKEIKKRFKMVNLIHPNTKIPKSSKLGEGNVIFDNVHISYKVNLGNHCIISNFSDIGHNLQSKDFLTIMPGTILGGNCKIGKKVLFGAGTIVSQNVIIGNNCKIGTSSLISKNLSDNVSVVNHKRQIYSKINIKK
tara:strand:- start:316 stop:957 length:642 start_codon:yes stop_codon:yes gene_type:complete